MRRDPTDGDSRQPTTLRGGLLQGWNQIYRASEKKNGKKREKKLKPSQGHPYERSAVRKTGPRIEKRQGKEERHRERKTKIGRERNQGMRSQSLVYDAPLDARVYAAGSSVVKRVE